jgi:CheY-like chemotaxis protein
MREIHILLAEDNRADVLLIREALAAHKIPYRLYLATDGAEALEFLVRMGRGETPCPDLILLDMNLPKTDGADVLQEFRSHPRCLTTPVIVVSSSDTQRDRQRVETLGVTRYFRKPTDFEAFMRLGAVVKEVICDLKPIG